MYTSKAKCSPSLSTSSSSLCLSISNVDVVHAKAFIERRMKQNVLPLIRCQAKAKPKAVHSTKFCIQFIENAKNAVDKDRFSLNRQ